MPYMDEGKMTLAPQSTNGTDDYNFSIPAMGPNSPNDDIEPVIVAHEADFGFNNTNQFKGIGSAMKFSLNDPDSGDKMTEAAFMFDIPIDGKNSLQCTLDYKDDNLKTFYSRFEGKRNQTNDSHQDNNLGIELSVTFDYLQGEHKGIDGSTGYYYNSMVVLSSIDQS